MTHEPARTLAAYALVLLYGGELADFEIENLHELAAGVGVAPGYTHKVLAEKRLAKEESASNELARLHAVEFQRRPWWKKLWL